MIKQNNCESMAGSTFYEGWTGQFGIFQILSPEVSNIYGLLSVSNIDMLIHVLTDLHLLGPAWFVT